MDPCNQTQYQRSKPAGRAVIADASSAVPPDFERLQEVLDNYLVANAILDSDLRFEHVNKLFCDVVNKDRDALLGCSLTEFFTDSDVDWLKQYAERMKFGDAEPGHRMVTIYRADGTARTAKLMIGTAATLRHGGFFICQIVDISPEIELRDARDGLQSREKDIAQKLRDLSRSKTNFVATVSHELRTPLTSMIGYVEMLRSGLGGHLSDRQGEMISVVERNAHRLLALVEDILTLSQVESGAPRSTPGRVELAVLFENCQSALQPAAERAGLTMTFQNTVRRLAVEGDADQLERALLNILENSIKFTPKGGTVVARAGQAGDAVTIEVQDSGIGISPNDHGSLFSTFYRASNASSFPGVGLGLAIVSGIVEAHGGSVAVESDGTNGTLMRITLPAASSRVVDQANSRRSTTFTRTRK